VEAPAFRPREEVTVKRPNGMAFSNFSRVSIPVFSGSAGVMSAVKKFVPLFPRYIREISGVCSFKSAKFKCVQYYFIVYGDLMPSQAITTRLRKELVKEIEAIARDEALDRSSAVQKLVEIGLREYRLKKALNLYRAGKVTVWKAAELAGVSLRAMIDLLKAHDISYEYDMDSLEEYVEQVLSTRKKP